MALSLNENPSKTFCVRKYSFNAEDDTERLIEAAEQAIKDRTEFINRCILHAGPLVLAAMT